MTSGPLTEFIDQRGASIYQLLFRAGPVSSLAPIQSPSPSTAATSPWERENGQHGRWVARRSANRSALLKLADWCIPLRPLLLAGGDGVKIGLPALDVARAFPQATPASLFPPAGETPACCSSFSLKYTFNSIRWNWEGNKKGLGVLLRLF
jgi:hypothetical protein